MWCISCLCFLAIQLFQVVMFFLLVLPNSPIAPKPWCSLLFLFFKSPIALKPSCSSFSCFSKCSSCLWFWSCCSLFLLLCDVHVPLLNNPMVPSHDALLAHASQWSSCSNPWCSSYSCFLKVQLLQAMMFLLLVPSHDVFFVIFS